MNGQEQIANYLAIFTLEKLGVSEPTEVQIGCLEKSLMCATQITGIALFLLEKAGVHTPSVNQINKVENEIRELIEKYKN